MSGATTCERVAEGECLPVLPHAPVKRFRTRHARHVVALLAVGTAAPPRYLTKRGTFTREADKALRFPSWHDAQQARRVSSFRHDPRVTILPRTL